MKALHILKRTLYFALILAFAVVFVYAFPHENQVSEKESDAPATTTLAADISPAPVPRAATPETLSPWKETTTTLFWVGEGASPDNDNISNVASYWDEKWQEHFGGVDAPECRAGYYPCGFTPRENPFYFALPYAEYDEAGTLKTSARSIPWFGKDDEPLLKNRWIAVRHGSAVCFGQWQDVGPNNEDDFSYVFGSTQPTNTFGLRAGLDISPALWKCLGMSENGITQWAFVDALRVPDGPWTDIVTASDVFWEG